MGRIPLIAVIIGVIAIYWAADFCSNNWITGTAVFDEENSSINVFFCPRQDCWGEIQQLINSSGEVECAFYAADPYIITLISGRPSHKAVIDDNNYGKVTKGLAADSGIIPVYSDGIMHNKFCIFDSRIVVTGSYNPTTADSFRNNNNLVVINSAALARNYEEKFQQLFVRGHERYSPKAAHMLKINGSLVENYFCPEDECSKNVVNKINSAKSEIYFMTFSFTDDSIGDALIKKNAEGVRISGIFDKQQISNFSEYKKLLDAGIDVSLDSNKYLMHHKVFIIDNETVITGSFNPSANANYRNDENILIINNRDIAKKYLTEFNYLKNGNNTQD
jgi:phosphatidylserine/phosphatidylglycerophosphate/cardiolipin synthase-like enzyme